jgi:hypothetical protein
MKETTRRTIRQIMLWGTLGGLAILYAFTKPKHRATRLTENQLDEMIEETFPASDPPSY